MKKIGALILLCCMLFLCVSCTPKVPDTLHARFAVLYYGDFPMELLTNPQENANQIKGFGVPDFAETFQDTASFNYYSVEINVSNETEDSVMLLGLTVDSDKNGKDGVYLGTYGDGGVYGLPARFTGKQELYYSVIADRDLSMDEVLKILGKMGAKFVYVDSTTGIESMEDLTDAFRMETAVLYEP